MITTGSPGIQQFCDTMIVASIDKYDKYEGKMAGYGPHVFFSNEDDIQPS